MMDKISVIIPVYNVELYIRKCLDSVINQTYPNLEILLVNDGSTDSGGKICDEYAEQDKRIRVFHKTNGGLSSARNVGLENCTGSYVGFVDSDDWIEPGMYEALYKALTDNGVQLSAVNFTRDTERASVIEAGREGIPKRVLDRKEMLLYVFRNSLYAGFGRMVWNKLFRMDAIKTYQLSFDESLMSAEDVDFTSRFIANDNITGFFVQQPFYHYLQRQGSLVHSDTTVYILNCLKSFHSIIGALSDKHELGDLTVWLKRDYCYNASLLAEKALGDNHKELFFMMRDAMKLYLKEYISINVEYPERIERINSLLERTCG